MVCSCSSVTVHPTANNISPDHPIHSNRWNQPGGALEQHTKSWDVDVERDGHAAFTGFENIPLVKKRCPNITSVTSGSSTTATVHTMPRHSDALLESVGAPRMGAGSNRRWVGGVVGCEDVGHGTPAKCFSRVPCLFTLRNKCSCSWTNRLIVKIANEIPLWARPEVENV